MDNSKSKYLNTLKEQIYHSPLYILWIITLLVFISESLAMIIISSLRPVSVQFEPILDSILLLILLSPAFYFFLFRPLELHIAQRKSMEEKCGKSCDHLEVTVQERTAELVETNVRLQREILERKKTEQGLKAAYSELKETYTQLIQAEKMQEVGRLASGVAHEVKNPLAIILQGVEYLKDKLKTEDENITLVLKYIGDAIIRADNVVVGLLDFASLSKFNMEPGDLNSSIDNSLSLLRNDLDRYHIQVARNFKENLPLVKIDNNRIEQVFVNIILNAIQAMPTGGLLSIKTDIEEQEENKKYVVVQIQDTGTGISKETLEKIFNPFFTTRRSAGGSGLGLAVSRHIIQMHGGKIDIENREDQFGVRVTLSFKA